jgi:DNA-binding XRE family transcriptional regulator
MPSYCVINVIYIYLYNYLYGIMLFMTNNIFNLRELGQAIRLERKALGLTQAELAKKAGLRRETIIQLEAGENISAHTLLQTCTSLGKCLRIDDIRLDYDRLRETFDEV